MAELFVFKHQQPAKIAKAIEIARAIALRQNMKRDEEVHELYLAELQGNSEAAESASSKVPNGIPEEGE